MTDSTQPATAKDGDVQTLEHRYIGLLERRIAQLESQLDESENATDEKGKGKKGHGKRGLPKENNILGQRDTPSPPPDSGPKPADGTNPTTSRVRNVVSRWDEDAEQRRDYDRQEVLHSFGPSQLTTFRRYMDSENRKALLREELDVGSERLRELLSDTLKHCAPHQFAAKEVHFVSPFRVFVWSWDRLEEACKPTDHDSDTMKMAREDLTEVLTLMKASDSLDTYFKSLASHQAGKTVTFEFIWTLFEPGTRVYMRSCHGELQMFEVQMGFKTEAPNKSYFTLLLSAFDWDGVNFKRYVYKVSIMKFEGSKPVTSLQCYPVSYYSTDSDPDGSKLREKLLQRGRKFFNVCTQKQGDFQFEYEGPMLYRSRPQRLQRHNDPRDEDDDDDVKQDTMKVVQLTQTKIIVDNYSYIRSRRNPGNGSIPLGTWTGIESSNLDCPCSNCKVLQTQSWTRGMEHFGSNKNQHDAFACSDERLLLCPPKVLGYSLASRFWGQLQITNIQDLDPMTAQDFDNYFEKSLELDRAQKRLLKAMIENHVTSKNKGVVSDPVQGKGQGLVILLHGPPGVGKTLTAETVALATGKPLLSVSTAEVGIEPEEAERNLAAIFEDASRWEAILLIDEADVFLEERKGTRDLQRNALVAVLLRVLEYYEGIIVLTTNRITTLDVAVQSRIHLAIQYHDLTAAQKEKIFWYFLDKTRQHMKDRDLEEIEKAIPKLMRKKKINGRQIRNILRSAYLLAQSDRAGLSLEHIEEVMEATETFLDSLKDLTMKKREFLEAPPAMS